MTDIVFKQGLIFILSYDYFWLIISEGTLLGKLYACVKVSIDDIYSVIMRLQTLQSGFIDMVDRSKMTPLISLIIKPKVFRFCTSAHGILV